MQIFPTQVTLAESAHGTVSLTSPTLPKADVFEVLYQKLLWLEETGLATAEVEMQIEVEPEVEAEEVAGSDEKIEAEPPETGLEDATYAIFGEDSGLTNQPSCSFPQDKAEESEFLFTEFKRSGEIMPDVVKLGQKRDAVFSGGLAKQITKEDPSAKPLPQTEDVSLELNAEPRIGESGPAKTPFEPDKSLDLGTYIADAADPVAKRQNEPQSVEKHPILRAQHARETAGLPGTISQEPAYVEIPVREIISRSPDVTRLSSRKLESDPESVVTIPGRSGDGLKATDVPTVPAMLATIQNDGHQSFGTRQIQAPPHAIAPSKPILDAQNQEIQRLPHVEPDSQMVDRPRFATPIVPSAEQKPAYAMRDAGVAPSFEHVATGKMPETEGSIRVPVLPQSQNFSHVSTLVAQLFTSATKEQPVIDDGKKADFETPEKMPAYPATVKTSSLYSAMQNDLAPVREKFLFQSTRSAKSVVVSETPTAPATEKSGKVFLDDATSGLASDFHKPADLVPEPIAGVGAAPAREIHVHRADAQRLPTAQFAEILSRQPDKMLEISLHPRELGHVKMTLSTGDSGVTLIITTERPETLDLMRRHSDQLSQDFRRLGYEGIGFEFRNGGASNGGDRQPGRPRHTGSDTQRSAEAAHSTSPTPPNRPVSSGLDLRL